MTGGLEHLCCEEKLRVLRLFSLQKIRLQKDLIVAFQYLGGPIRKMGTGFLQGPVMLAQGAMVLN